MKDAQATQSHHSFYKAWPPSVSGGQAPPANQQAIIIGLMMPFTALVLNLSMFNVALPAVRDAFGTRADVTAWLATAYTLPFIIFMPFYGRVGDGLGKRRLLLVGIVVFMMGSVITSLATTLPFLILGRVIQGVGTASVTPLCIAIISTLFPGAGRGQAMGTWNSVGPLTAVPAPLIGGFLIDYLGWRAIFGPVLLGSMVAWFVLHRCVPATLDETKHGFWRTFDWVGMLLLSTATTILVFYISSRPVTGVEPLQDWRLLFGALILFGLFVFWEKGRATPFVALNTFAVKNFSRASFGAAIRMFALSGVIGFLMPLYLTDIHRLSAAATGTILLLHAGALFSTMRFGGQLADRGPNRWPVVIGSSIQVAMMTYFALLPDSGPVWLVVTGLIVHGLGAGLSLAALHRSSMGKISQEQIGGAAGLYSMIRFGGTVLGIALIGVILQFGLDYAPSVIAAYQLVFWFVAGVALLGVILGIGLQD